MTWERCEQVGLQWPCRDENDPGTPTLCTEGFPNEKAHFRPSNWRPPVEVPTAEYPLTLSTGRRLWHYNTSQTRVCQGINELFGEPFIEMNPKDAEARGIKSGDYITASSKRGQIGARAWVTRRSPEGVVWSTFHFFEACANVLTNDVFDPQSETAEYKACGVQVIKDADGPALLDRERQARP